MAIITLDPSRVEHFRKLATQHSDLRRVLTPRLNSYIIKQPTAKQSLFLLLNRLQEVFYGGAAGGGKSEALLMAALQYVDVPGYSALILRRTYKDLSLPNAIMDRARQWLRASDAHWSPSKYTFEFPSGAKLTFGYIQYEADVYQYDSAEFQFIGFDELTQFLEPQYRFMFGRLRRTNELRDAGVPLRMRAASNPGGVGHLWCKNRFIKDFTPDRLFIPANIKDNRHLDYNEYVKQLSQLDPILRAQRLDGDWDVDYQGNAFNRAWFEGHYVDKVNGRRIRRCRAWDFAATQGGGDFTVGALLAQDVDTNRFAVEHVIRGQWGPSRVEQIVKAFAEKDTRSTLVRIEQEPGSSGKAVVDSFTRMLAGWDVKGVPASGSKETRWRPFAAQCEAGNVDLCNGTWTNDYLDEMSTVPANSHDDQADASATAFNALTADPIFEYGVSRL
jgi:predicted phage terminase large subunit-like protein